MNQTPEAVSALDGCGWWFRDGELSGVLIGRFEVE